MPTGCTGAGASKGASDGAAMTTDGQGDARFDDSGATADGGLSCSLGGGCAQTQVCTGGIGGCASNCQCLDGTWQAPCPANLPHTGSACTAAGAQCGYATSTNACGAANCYCQGGAWSCGPTCVIGDSSVDLDVGTDVKLADAAPNGG
jgi:hypothetical protein